MSDLNCISLTGRLTRDSELKYFPSGTSYLSFDIANNTGYGNFAKVNYFHVMLLGKSAESIRQYMLKGQMIALFGTLETDEWTGRDGAKHRDWKLTTTNVQLIGSRKQEGGNGGNGASHDDYPNPPDVLDEVSNITF